MNRVSMRLIVIVAALPALALPRSGAREPKPQNSTATSPAQSKFVGVAGCAAMACHGGTRPNERGEYTTWIERDRHARAVEVLSTELSQRIAASLALKSPAHEEQTCLACHSTASAEQGGPRFTVADGVSCESCHGIADRWLVPHSQASWKQISAKDKSEKYGMMDTKNAAVRAQVCVTCHVGSSDREVNHELIAAGHPPLMFELDAFTANMPPHWRETPDKPATFGAQAWAVGQAVVIKQSMELLKAQAVRGQWPEFAQFECYACHHDLKEQSWRQTVGYGDRRPGSPVWSSPQWLLVQRLARSSGAELAGADDYAAVRKLLSQVNAAAPDVASAAEKAAAAATQIVHRTAQEKWDGVRLRRLLADLSADPDAAALDYAVASQVTMALGAVFEAVVRADSVSGAPSKTWHDKVRPQLDRLYDGVQRPTGFDVNRFTADLKSFREAL